MLRKIKQTLNRVNTRHTHSSVLEYAFRRDRGKAVYILSGIDTCIKHFATPMILSYFIGVFSSTGNPFTYTSAFTNVIYIICLVAFGVHTLNRVKSIRTTPLRLQHEESMTAIRKILRPRLNVDNSLDDAAERVRLLTAAAPIADAFLGASLIEESFSGLENLENMHLYDIAGRATESHTLFNSVGNMAEVLNSVITEASSVLETRIKGLYLQQVSAVQEDTRCNFILGLVNETNGTSFVFLSSANNGAQIAMSQFMVTTSLSEKDVFTFARELYNHLKKPKDLRIQYMYIVSDCLIACCFTLGGVARVELYELSSSSRDEPLTIKNLFCSFNPDLSPLHRYVEIPSGWDAKWLASNEEASAKDIAYSAIVLMNERNKSFLWTEKLNKELENYLGDDLYKRQGRRRLELS